MLMRESRRRLLGRLEREFGREPEVSYKSGDMDGIAAYHNWVRDRRPGEFHIDGVTWFDLDMDRLFKRMNAAQSTPGEQYLYHLLHTPALDAGEFARRRGLISLGGGGEDERLRIQYVLARLGRFRRADVRRVFAPEAHGAARLALYVLLALCFTLSPLLAIPCGPGALAATVGLFILNTMLRELVLRRVQGDFDAVNFSVAMVFALRRLKRLGIPRLDGQLRGAYAALERLRPILRTGGVSRSGSGDMGDLISSVFLLDLIVYEYLKTRLAGLGGELTAVFEALGGVDAGIAIASWRELQGQWCEPELSFDGAGAEARALVHPLLKNAVPNDWDGGSSALVTGSNASGKSTYLRTVLLSALLSECVCTCPGESYRGGAFRIYSSMAPEDDIFSGESYYMAEIRAVKRILDAAAQEGPRVLCVLDEVLRGTNTIERIAAAGEILSALDSLGCLCLAATHDVELCSLLGGRFRLLHFEEHIDGGEMAFDYLARPGRARTRNAIRLLELMGLGGEITERADERARRFMETGSWTAGEGEEGQ